METITHSVLNQILQHTKNLKIETPEEAIVLLNIQKNLDQAYFGYNEIWEESREEVGAVA